VCRSVYGIGAVRMRVGRSFWLFVCGSPGFTNVHEEIFADRSDAVEPGLFGDFPEFVFVCGEGDPRGPNEGAPVIEEVGDIFGVEVRLICGIGTHSLLMIG